MKDPLSDFWKAQNQFATVLLTMFVDTYGITPDKEGVSPLTWSPETIRMEIEEDFDIQLPQGNFDRLLAAIGLLTTDDFYMSPTDFVAWCNMLSGDVYDPGVWDPADVHECAWGVTEAAIIAPPESDFSPEVLGYIGEAIATAGLPTQPEVLRFVPMPNPGVGGLASLTTDPTMFGAVYGMTQNKVADVDRYVRDSLLRLAEQLDRLPLRSGSSAGAVSRALQSSG